MMAKVWSEAEVEQILRENAQLRKMLAEYQRYVRREHGEKRAGYAARKVTPAQRVKRAVARACATFKKIPAGYREVLRVIDRLPTSVIAVCSIMSGFLLAMSILLWIEEAFNHETLLWLQNIR